MQSLWQYRHIGLKVRCDYERYRARTTRSPKSSYRSSPTSDLPPKYSATKAIDPEKLIYECSKPLPPAPHDSYALSDSIDSHGSFSPSDSSRKGHTRVDEQLWKGVEYRSCARYRNGQEGVAFVVGFENSNDELNPRHWSLRSRTLALLNVSMIAWLVGFASSVDSAVVAKAAADFQTSETIESLATGLFLIAFGIGSLVAGPISEEYGRNPVYLTSLGGLAIFIAASSLSNTISLQLLFRFLAGLCGSTPLACAGGSVADLFTPGERVIAFPVFAVIAFVGPLFGPVIGGFVADAPPLTWRWCDWTTLCFTAVVLLSVGLLQCETHAPQLLRWKARHIRSVTGERRYMAENELHAVSLSRRLLECMFRPIEMLLWEPIVILFGLYLTVIYMVMFGFFEGFRFIYSRTYGISACMTGLCFLAIAAGIFLALPLIPVLYDRYCHRLYRRRRQRQDPTARLPPEERLIWAMLGAPLLPLSLYWMAFTARSDVSIWAPITGSIVFGLGTMCVFIASYLYLIDSYEEFAASALSGVTLLRYLVSGGVVVVAIPMYEQLTVKWTLVLMAVFGTIMMPVPFVLWRWGPNIRAQSKMAAHST